MTSAFDITRSVNPPRAAFLDFPLGHTAGKPNEPEVQRRIMLEALAAFESFKEPGSIAMLPFRWSEQDEWKKTAQLEGGDQRTSRTDEPQYQCEADRLIAEANLAAGPARDAAGESA